MEIDLNVDGAAGASMAEYIPTCSSGRNSYDNNWQIPHIDDSNTNLDKPTMERVITYLDSLDSKVEKLRKEALELQEKKDTLLVSIDLIKNHDAIGKLNECEREEINYYIHRVSARLGTVDLSVKTVRDNAQEESLHQINGLIDSLITSRDPIASRHRCQTFLNACDTNDASTIQKSIDEDSMHVINIDKKFENFLLGCTLDDQKNIKKRLQALINYLNKQIVTD